MVHPPVQVESPSNSGRSNRPATVHASDASVPRRIASEAIRRRVRAAKPLRRLLLQVVLELAAPRRVAQLAQRLRLDLADPLAGDVELLADLLEGPGPAVLQPEAELEHAALSTGQR